MAFLARPATFNFAIAKIGIGIVDRMIACIQLQGDQLHGAGMVERFAGHDQGVKQIRVGAHDNAEFLPCCD